MLGRSCQYSHKLTILQLHYHFGVLSSTRDIYRASLPCISMKYSLLIVHRLLSVRSCMLIQASNISLSSKATRLSGGKDSHTGLLLQSSPSFYRKTMSNESVLVSCQDFRCYFRGVLCRLTRQVFKVDLPCSEVSRHNVRCGLVCGIHA